MSSPATEFPTLLLKSGRDRSLLNKHPWIFSGAVKQGPKAVTGDIIRVADNHNKTLAYGFFDDRSEIVCKVFEFTNADHILFDSEYWNCKFEKALQLRKELVISDITNCYRLIHAEGDGMPGLIVDIYNKTAVMQVLHKGMENILDILKDALLGMGYLSVYIKTKQSTKQIEHLELEKKWYGEKPGEALEVLEHGLKFKVDVEEGQKTGFFLDQRENRLLVRQLSKNKNVLNAFSYTGGFSVYAIAGEASRVDSVDISKDAISACEENVKLNFPNHEHHQAIVADCFNYLREMPDDYDLIILDPPAFAKNARSVPNATRGYKEINMLAFRKIKPGGMLFTFSCSKNIDRDLFRKIVFGAAADSGRNVRIIYQLTQPADHSINIYHPEGEYLKGLVLYVE